MLGTEPRSFTAMEEIATQPRAPFGDHARARTRRSSLRRAGVRIVRETVALLLVGIALLVLLVASNVVPTSAGHDHPPLPQALRAGSPPAGLASVRTGTLDHHLPSFGSGTSGAPGASASGIGPRGTSVVSTLVLATNTLYTGNYLSSAGNNPSPVFVAYDPSDGDLYIDAYDSYTAPGVTYVVNATTDSVVATLTCGVVTDGIFYDPTGGEVFEANYGDNNFTVIKGTQVVGSITVTNGGPNGMAVDTANGDVFAPEFNLGTVTVIDGKTNSVLHTTTVGNSPWNDVYDPANGDIYVANGGSNSISVINGTSFGVVATIPVAADPFAIGFDPATNEVYAANDSNSATVNSVVDVIDAATNTVKTTIALADPDVGQVAYDPVNGFVYITEEPVSGNGDVVAINGTTLSIVGRAGVGYGPIGLIDPSASSPLLDAVNFAGGSLSILDAPLTNEVDFTESGLLSGTPWTVTFGSASNSSSTSTVAFAALNGTYAYTITPVAGYRLNPSSGTVTVSGSAVQVAVTFTAPHYPVTFTGSGLPGGTPWSVTLNGVLNTSSTSSIGFSEPNGTLSYTLGSVAGYASNPSSGHVTVAGGPQSIDVTFTALPPTDYAVTFQESGLPVSSSWSATLGGTLLSSTSNTIAFSEVNGSYDYSVAAVTGYAPSPSSGIVVVAGAAAAVDVTFHSTAPQSFFVTFTESGLVDGTLWSTTLGGQVLTATTDSIAFSVTNGTYLYSVAGQSGFRVAPSSGQVTVDGTAQAVDVTFSAVAPALFPLVFIETGLPAGTSWTVSAGGGTFTRGSPSITFQLANGTYAFEVGAVSGYQVAPRFGNLSVAGASLSEAIVFTAQGGSTTPTSSPSGGSNGGTSSLELVGILIGAVGAIAGAVFYQRQRKTPPTAVSSTPVGAQPSPPMAPYVMPGPPPSGGGAPPMSPPPASPLTPPPPSMAQPAPVISSAGPSSSPTPLEPVAWPGPPARA